MNRLIVKISSTFVFALLLVSVFVTPTYAHHSWNGYHWARTSNPFSVTLGDNVSSAWLPFLYASAYYWDRSAVLNVPVVKGSTNPAVCTAKYGQVQVCNSAYGNTGWLGLAQISVVGSHITQGTVKLNDTYFTQPRFNTNAWKNLVACQEVGHTLGLDHQDTDFNNAPLGTCMDYTNDPTPNQHPNAHDYEELLIIYGHRDGFGTQDTTVAGDTSVAVDTNSNDRSDWGNLVSGSEPNPTSTTVAEGETGHVATYEKDLGAEKKLQTVVIWVK